MQFTLIFPMYLIWHYHGALKDIRRLYRNSIWFIYHLFSVELLLKTLFSPFHRLSGKEAGGDKENIFARITVNLLMRIIGFFLRSIIILSGLLSLIFVNLGFVLFFIIWLFMPIMIPLFILLGIGFFI